MINCSSPYIILKRREFAVNVLEEPTTDKKVRKRLRDSKMKKLIRFFIVFLLLYPLPAAALQVEVGEPDTAATTLSAASTAAVQGPLQITVTLIRPSKPRMGDLVEVEVKVVAQPQITLLDVDYGKTLGEWEVVDVQPGKVMYKDGHFVRVDRLRLQTFSAGQVEIPAIIQPFKGADGKAAEFHSMPVSIQVEPLPRRKGDQPGHIRGLKAPQGMTSWWLLSGVLLVLAGISAGLAWYFYRQRKLETVQAPSLPPRPPEEIARERLTALRNSDLLRTGQFKSYYIDLSDILRRYVEERFRVPAIDRTTHELMREIRQAAIQRQDVSAIRNVLEQSDMVKFAKWLPTEKEALADWQAVYDLVERTTDVLPVSQENKQEETAT